MSVLNQSYQCGTWFVCSILRELAVSNLGQPLFCLSITWSRCRNAYRDLWIMTIQFIHNMCVIKARTHGCVRNDSETHSIGVTGLHSRLRQSCNPVTQTRAFYCHFIHTHAFSLYDWPEKHCSWSTWLWIRRLLKHQQQPLFGLFHKHIKTKLRNDLVTLSSMRLG